MGKAKKILAIDDNQDILYTLEQICRFQGWEPLLASNYQEAQNWIGKETIDLILVDYHMPEMDGVTVLKKIRRVLPTIPVIVLTVEERESIMEKFMAAGATDYALKPIKAIDLISRIKVHLQYHEKSQYYEDHQKGINRVTLTTIVNALRDQEDYLNIEEIEAATRVKKKTLYRYLQYLVKEGKLECKYSYGEMGRPKTYYKWR